jgi:hypothetical protein
VLAFLSGEALVLPAFAAEALVPLVLAALLPRRVRLAGIVIAGCVGFAWICAAAHTANLATNSGDLAEGSEGWAFVIAVNAIHFIPLWLIGTVIGWKLSEKRFGPISRAA